MKTVTNTIFGPSSYEPGSKLLVLGMVIPPLIGNPYSGYINPYYWVDDHPLLYGNHGSLDPGTYTSWQNLPFEKLSLHLEHFLELLDMEQRLLRASRAMDQWMSRSTLQTKSNCYENGWLCHLNVASSSQGPVLGILGLKIPTSWAIQLPESLIHSGWNLIWKYHSTGPLRNAGHISAILQWNPNVRKKTWKCNVINFYMYIV